MACTVSLATADFSLPVLNDSSTMLIKVPIDFIIRPVCQLSATHRLLEYLHEALLRHSSVLKEKIQWRYLPWWSSLGSVCMHLDSCNEQKRA